MNDKTRQLLLEQVDADKDELLSFLSDFVRAKSPNPPGDTRDAAAHVRARLEAEGIDVRTIDPRPEFPNLVASFEGPAAGKHLVLNGHIDVFPVLDSETWRYGPWTGELAEGKLWGRGACDMKCGTTCSVFTFIYLHRLRDQLKGRLTLTAVSDEETFGPWGARYLMEHHPEVHGDCCLNAEPSSPLTIRFAEKGPLWLRFTVRTNGGHAAYTHTSESATKIGAQLVADLETLTDLDTPAPGNVGPLITRHSEDTNRALGEGAADIVQKLTVNIGTFNGGVKVNMIPSECVIEADIRFPIGVEQSTVMERIGEILQAYPQVSMEELLFNPPNWCSPEHEMMDILKSNVEALRGFRPAPVSSLGGTDARLWRYQDIPAFVYGPYPSGMGSADEHVDVEDFFHVLRTHLLSAYDYLSG